MVDGLMRVDISRRDGDDARDVCDAGEVRLCAWACERERVTV